MFKIKIVFLLFIFFFWMSLDVFLKSTVPTESGSLKLKALHKDVNIYRDSLGIPFIEAQNEDDLFFAAGYVHASDRLWQMVSLKMLSQGRLAELLGSRVLSADLYMRTVGIHHYAKKILNQYPEHLRHKMTQFSKGVNAFAANHILPIEFHLLGYKPEKWAAIDSICVYLFLNLMLSTNQFEELVFLDIFSKLGFEKSVQLFPKYIGESVSPVELNKLRNVNFQTALPFHDSPLQSVNEIIQLGLPASNNWVVSPKIALKKKALLANDTHMEHVTPAIWLLMVLKSPNYRVAGASLPGVPLVAAGYNGKIAWGVTMLMADTQDIFLEKIKKIKGKTHYLFKGRWLPVIERKETFRVRGQKDEVRIIESTHHGPLMNEVLKEKAVAPFRPDDVRSEYGIANCWSVKDGDRSGEGFYLLGKAQNIKELNTAVSLIDGMPLNFVYSDGDNIGWIPSGKLPLRNSGEGKFPSPGWTGLYDWKGYVPYQDKPQKLNPAQGFIVTANNRVTETAYPHITSSWYGPERADRASEMLKEKGNRIDFDDMLRMQFDRKSLFHNKVRKVLLQKDFLQVLADPDILTQSQKVKKEKKKNMLSAWNKIVNFHGNTEPHSHFALVYQAFLYSFTRNTFHDELNASWEGFMGAHRRTYDTIQDHLITPQKQNSTFFDNIQTPFKEDKFWILLESLSDASEFCHKRSVFNENSLKWGNLHQYAWVNNFGKALSFLSFYFNRGPHPAGGAKDTLNVASFAWGDQRFYTTEVPALKLIVDFSKKEPLFMINSSGQSGNPSSHHYDDMIPYFLSGKNHQIFFHSLPEHHDSGRVLSF